MSTILKAEVGELDIFIGAHGSSTFDYENDGDDDIIATNWADVGLKDWELKTAKP